ncbi:MAG: TonB-dependent receptor plug domain-containing protein [Endomicrobiia bacterium]
MRKNLRILVIFDFIFLIFNYLYAVDVHLELTKSPIKTEGYILTQPETNTKTVEVINSEEIKKLPVNSIEELLDYFVAVDSQKRGPFSVQSDISIRGGNFQQTLVLIDGVKVSDPQTGHFNLDIPFTLEDIEKIEILRGSGSSSFGPGAFTGAINIITKRRSVLNRVCLSYGGYNTARGLATISRTSKDTFQRFSFEKTKSDGWLKKDSKNLTDFDITKFSISTGYKKLKLDYGLLSKDFGAYDFYSPKADADSRESTDTEFVKFSFSDASPEFDIFYRKHFDRFIYKYSIKLGENNHTTNVYGLNFRIYPFFKERNLVFGIENIFDEINSTKLGRHSQTRYGLFSEYRQAIKKNLDFNFGIRYDSHSNKKFGTVLSPSLGASYKPLNNFRLRTSISTGYRTPSFTELYYEDPSNKGNPELKSEKNISGEIGFDLIGFRISGLNTSVFYRKEEDIIDWGRYSNTEKWTARNIKKIDFSGFETKIFFKFSEFDIKTGYSYQHADSEFIDKNYESKYILRYPENLLSAEIFFPFFILRNMEATFAALYKKRVSEDGYFLLNARLKYSVGYSFEISLKGTNLLDTKYEEVLGVPQPGRWFTFEVSFEF